ncbi:MULTISPECIES: BolA family protein [Cyanophyceae]|uniref:BolA family transcriptional regulator n=2 Tax=Cyanophyceae TaxID=3028117 RepID=A0A4Q7E1M4_9CYAN|nr:MULTISPECIES: BolA family transcriptional regulator [Cyanophyceae]MCM1984379.1 BolA family transcriptional regulator [Lyngbya confervoides BDU141951]RZM74856.1 BolA family transcriptional regulator [Leptolyngbya sp. LK]
MVTADQVISMIQTDMPDAEVQVNDLTGGGDHLEVTVVSEAFAGRSLVQQHQLVYKAVQSAMSSEAIHALALKTYTPETWSKVSQSA